ncbi:probable polypeptide N-acetylgalactosaminyltransferase 8 [Nematolebias whitei]|uniref:probable polypeptide N-acetylgalactosaminyltransferase 8 n=1 Tax=Nematolebias whitei TaxID=451745 RepID=UPI00189B8748|nr:probable polypeptide N-acetylgalactosaminyltransferase 8 [Nematolebias whitei]
MRIFIRVGIIGAFLLLMYLMISMSGSWRVKRSFPEGVTDQKVVSGKLDRIEQTLNKLAKLVEEYGQKKFTETDPLDVDQEKEEKQQKPVIPKLYPDSYLFTSWGDDLSQEEQKEAEALFHIYGYNAFLSNRIPLNRKLPDSRDSRCLVKNYPTDLPSIGVVLIFVNEALSIIKRAVESIITHTPRHLLKEIILVDDHSTYNDLGKPLDDYIDQINKERPGLVKKIWHLQQMGLSQSRITGWEHATADVVAILDAHIEATQGWAEPLLARIKADRTVVVSPVFDKVHFDDLHVERYIPSSHGFDWALWCMYESFSPDWLMMSDESQPGKSPSVMGIFAADRDFLGEIGGLDGGMTVYGGENVELGIRVWLCGGSVEIVPCSRIAHIERAHKPYAPDLDPAMRRNALRVSDIWLDEYKRNVFIAWNIPLQVGCSTSYSKVVDVAKAIVSAVKDPDVLGKTYVLVGPNRYILYDLVKYLYKVSRTIFVPYSLPRPLFHLAAIVLSSVPHDPWTTPDKVDRFHISDLKYPGLPGMEDLGITASTVEQRAIEVLRRHRRRHYRDPDLEEIKPPKTVTF